MTAKHSIEVERKYDVAPETRAPALDAVPGYRAVDRGTVLLDATYFDTADRRLLAQQVVVRRRLGGHDAGWHIKRTTGGAREETQWEIGDDSERVPDELLADVANEVAGAQLDSLAQIVTTRTLTVLIDQAGAEVVEFADDLVTAIESATGDERRWREWEAELLPGAPTNEADRSALLDEIERELLLAGATPSASPAKIARALGLVGD